MKEIAAVWQTLHRSLMRQYDFKSYFYSTEHSAYPFRKAQSNDKVPKAHTKHIYSRRVDSLIFFLEAKYIHALSRIPYNKTRHFESSKSQI